MRFAIDVEKLTIELLKAGKKLSITRDEACAISGLSKDAYHDRIRRGELPKTVRGRMFLPLFIACLQDPDILRKSSQKQTITDNILDDSELPGELPDNTRTWINQARKR